MELKIEELMRDLPPGSEHHDEMDFDTSENRYEAEGPYIFRHHAVQEALR